jgi:hypothetical protein
LIVLLPGAATAAIDANPFSRMTWSLVVCLSLGLGTAVARRQVLALATAGLAGAPLAFALARAARLASTGLLRAVESGASPSPWLLGAIKGVEYACLGAALAWLGRRGKVQPVSYATAGLAAGMVFGGLNLALTAVATANPLSLPVLLAWAVNELLFPAGCALVIWTIHRRHTTQARSEPMLKRGPS